MYLEALGVIVPIVRPWAVMLLVVTGVGLGWASPISLSVVERCCNFAAIVESSQFCLGG
jgi:hypothetical protein